eukprot:scaffold197_cov268-Chaetoceros_neogracile.AAC.9
MSKDIDIIQDEDISLRFSGVGRLYQQESAPSSDTIEVASSHPDLPHVTTIKKLSSATVAIVGIGGVGSWAAEAICRSGVGNIILVDLDDICTSNINRQLHALSSTVGKTKIDEMSKRLLDINPTCNITLIHDFIGTDNAEDIVKGFCGESAQHGRVDVILDAIDGTDEKAALIAAACRNGVPIVTCGGAAGRVDPTQIICDDLSKSSQCRLLFWCKKQLRDKYKLFPKGQSPKGANVKMKKTRKWRIWSVYSEEVVGDKGGGGGVGSSSLRTCDGPLGTACFVTGTYGFVAASKIVSMLANDELVKPKILKSALSLPIPK